MTIMEESHPVPSVRLLLDATTDGICGVDTSRRCTFMNAAGARMLGYRAEELVGADPHPLIHHTREDGRPHPAEECPLSHALQGADVAPYDDVLWRKDGTPLPVRMSARPVWRDGRVESAVVVFSDDSDRRRTLRDLLARTRELEAMGDALSAYMQGAGIRAAAGRLLECALGHSGGRHGFIGMAESGGQVLRVLAGDAVACRCTVSGEADPPRDEEGFPRVVLRAPPIRDPACLVVPLLAGTETTGLICVAGIPGRPSDAHAFLLETLSRAGAVLVDAHHRQREERALQQQLQQAQKMEAVGRLAGGIAHDFNNVLTAIIGYSELLLAQFSPNDPRYDQVTEILSGGERAAGLTRQLLAFSRRQVVAPRPMRLNTVLGGLEKMLRRLIGEDLELEIRADAEQDLVIADAGQIEQVLLNLAINARDAMPDGGYLRIRTSNPTASPGPRRGGVDSNRAVVLEVSDSGVGMSEEVQAHIFEPFFTTKDAGRGTGLGLATVYGIVQQGGGGIRVHSREGVGTTFEISLPVAADEGAGPPARGMPVDTPRGSERILLVEDDPSVRSLARSLLCSLGYEVTVADSGLEALERVAGSESPFDLLITDVVMPGMGGRELAEHVRATVPDLEVLFISGYTDDEVLRRGVAASTLEYLNKPFTLATLGMRVRELLNRSRASVAESIRP